MYVCVAVPVCICAWVVAEAATACGCCGCVRVAAPVHFACLNAYSTHTPHSHPPQWLVDVHGVCVIPGSACGAPGHIRVAYANLPREMCLEAAARLHKGLRELADKGAAAMDAGS